MSKKVKFITLGCKVNQYETESMMEMFKRKDYDVVEDGLANICVINTCTVTNLADRKSRQMIRRERKQFPEMKIVVTGCYAQTNVEDLELMEEVDLIIGNQEKKNIVALCEDLLSSGNKEIKVSEIMNHHTFDEMPLDMETTTTRAFIKVQDGCQQFCSYCIIPYARGPIRSRRIDDVVEECRQLDALGYKEVVLSGIHVASFGKDTGEGDWVDLVESIAKNTNIPRIRTSSMEVRGIDRAKLERLVATEKLCDHFHLSLQSGSDRILKSMNRHYTAQEFLSQVELIREYYPNVGITTDVIVGFPGETDRLFQETVDFINEVKFSRIHVFPYSPRQGTPAAQMKEQIQGDVKKERSRILTAWGETLEESFARSQMGIKQDILLERHQHDKDYLEGYTTNYIHTLLPVDQGDINEIKKIKIVDYKKPFAYGKIV